MNNDKDTLGQLILGMREEYKNGGNAMAWARANAKQEENVVASTLIAYDLQAGSYVAQAIKNPNYLKKWGCQLADLIRPYIDTGDSILEIGIGEATTLTGVITALDGNYNPLGFDISWSRIKVAQNWLSHNETTAKLFVGDLFNIPLADNSVDIIYTSHSLEPNGGREKAAVRELLRVARKAVVLVEPIFELANAQAQERMLEHGYVKGLKVVAEKLDVNIAEYGLLDIFSNPLNPSGVVLMLKNINTNQNGFNVTAAWQCPTTYTPIEDHGDLFYTDLAGIAYPVLRGVPMLRVEHAIVASKM